MKPNLQMAGRGWMRAALDDGTDSPGGKIPGVSIVAYNGGILHVGGFPLPVVVDLQGLEFDQVNPILIDHEADMDNILGQTTSVTVDGSTIVASGSAMGVSERARRVVAMAKAGYEWEASIGCVVGDKETIPAGRTVDVNGQTFQGPIIVARSAVLREISFVATGAGEQTEARIAAALAGASVMTGTPAETMAAEVTGSDDITFGDWLKKVLLIDPTALSEAQMKAFQKEFASKYQPNENPPDASSVQARFNINRGTTMPTMLSKSSPVTIAAAMCLRAGLSNVERHFKPDVLEVADQNYKGSFGLKRLLLQAAAANGCSMYKDQFGENHHQILKAAFSTADIGGILSNVAGKFLLEGWNAVEDGWRKIAGIRPVADFKDSTSFRLTSSGVMEQMAGSGQLKHGTLTEDVFTNRAFTYGEIITITRAMQINDDLDCLTRIPKMLGRKAALTVANVFWTKWFAVQSALWPTTNANANYIDGAGTTAVTGSVLSSNALTRAAALFRKQTDSEGNPLGLEPKYILVPPELEVTAREIYQSTNVNTGGASTSDRVPNANTFSGRFEPVVSSYLSNANFEGASATAWWLMADAMASDVAAVEVSFLNGKQEPTVETGAPDFNQLGLSLRAYIDFGVSHRDHRAGVKSKGAAA